MSVLPLPTPDEAFDLDALIQEQMRQSNSASPKDLADEIAALVPADDLREALRVCLPGRVRRVIQAQRRPGRVKQIPSSAPVAVAPDHDEDDEPRRWEVVRLAQESGALAIYRWRVHLDGDWKFFEDCSKSDVSGLVEAYTKRAVDMADQAQRFKAVLRAMRESEAARVGDVPVARLVEIFNA